MLSGPREWGQRAAGGWSQVFREVLRAWQAEWVTTLESRIDRPSQLRSCQPVSEVGHFVGMTKAQAWQPMVNTLVFLIPPGALQYASQLLNLLSGSRRGSSKGCVL